MNKLDRFRGCLFGLACGDAVGTAVEFRSRGSFEPVTDMVGGGPFQLQPGEWTDDTSMALCLAASLVELGNFDAKDQMERYCRWVETGYMSSNGRCFDVGVTVGGALNQFRKSGNPFCGPTNPQTAGNGCIMRLAPIPMFYYPDRSNAIKISGESSRTTHGAEECIDCSQLFGAILFQALDGGSKEDVLLGHGMKINSSEKISRIANGDYRQKSESDIRGSGYVVDSLEAALWCFWKTDNYKDAVLLATNLGDDTDTTAAICGQVAGAFYGESGIPKHWLERLAMKDTIGTFAENLYSKNHANGVLDYNKRVSP